MTRGKPWSPCERMRGSKEEVEQRRISDLKARTRVADGSVRTHLPSVRLVVLRNPGRAQTTGSQQRRQTLHHSKDGCSVGVPGSSDCRCHGEPFHVFFFLRRQAASHTRLACTHIQTESKRGCIKQVSDLDDSLDVQVVGRMGRAGGVGGRGSRSSP